MNSLKYSFHKRLPEQSFLAGKYAKALLMSLKEKPNDTTLTKYLTLFLILKQKPLLLQQLQYQPEILKKIGQTLEFDELNLKFLTLLQQHKKLLLLPTICLHLSQLITKQNNQTLFTVSSSAAFDQAEKAAVLKFLATQTTHSPLVFFAVDKQLISGIRIQADCFLYEKSIKSRINKVLLTLKMITT